MKPIRRDYFPRIEQFITEYREANGTAPSIKEIAAYLNVCNTTAWRYIQRMASEGLLDYQGGYGRISTISSLSPVVFPCLRKKTLRNMSACREAGSVLATTCSSSVQKVNP